MITKFTYLFFNYRKIMIVFILSFIQSVLLRIPLINININLMELANAPITSLYNICPLFINAGLLYFAIYTIVKIVQINCLLNTENYKMIDTEQLYKNEHNIYYYFDRLDKSNPFLYSNKVTSLLE